MSVDIKQIRVWAVLLVLTPACGGAPFALDPGPDATPDAEQVEATAPDGGFKLKPEASAPEAQSPEASTPIEAGADRGTAEASADAGDPDACAAVAPWSCRGRTIGVHAICATYVHQDGGLAGVVIAEAPNCPWCGASCACIGVGPCGTFGSDPISHLSSCVEHGPNQVEVTCQEGP